MHVDKDALRRMTEEAIRRGEEQRRAELEAQRLEEERKRLEQELKAREIIAQIPSRCQTEAAAGRSFAIVMSIASGDYRQPGGERGYGVCKPDWLLGAARLVFDACVDAGLAPTIEYWHDGVGVQSGFNILAHW